MSGVLRWRCVGSSQYQSVCVVLRYLVGAIYLECVYQYKLYMQLIHAQVHRLLNLPRPRIYPSSGCAMAGPIICQYYCLNVGSPNQSAGLNRTYSRRNRRP